MASNVLIKHKPNLKQGAVIKRVQEYLTVSGKVRRTGAMAATGDAAGVWFFLFLSTTINLPKLQALCLLQILESLMAYCQGWLGLSGLL